MVDDLREPAPKEGSLSPSRRALLALEDLQGRLEERERAETEPIAIVGMGCRFPGAGDAASFWNLLVSGVDAITEVPGHRWDIRRLYHPDQNARGRISGLWGGFLQDLDRFDAEFFGISPREAPFIDPRQRLLLEVAWEALEDGGLRAEDLTGSDTGVFVGVLTNDYDQLISRRPEAIEMYTGTGTANAMVANRLSYTFDWNGPSMALDTACSGSLLAVHLGCQALRSGEAGLALAGGVALNLLPNGDIFFSRAGSLSPAGRCRAFDKEASGIVRSEGAGLVVLKRLSRAEADGDRIYALIRGSATNHDGRSNGIMAPRGEAQEAVLRSAYQRARVDPRQVQYVEAHGTGTRVGDPIEVAALARVLGDGRPSGAPLHLGSVKTNLGHMESAAGAAGVMKVALALSHRRLPATLHFRELNPLIEPTPFPLRVQDELGPWPDEGSPLLAGVNGFGFGGSNVHVVLEEPPKAKPDEPPVGSPEEVRSRVVTLSAASEEGLRQLAGRWRSFLAEGAGGATLEDLAYTSSCRRSHHRHRLALTAAGLEELDGRLESFLAGEKGAPGVACGQRGDGAPPGLAFAYSGQGGQWLGMGRKLLQQEAAFREALEECHQRLEGRVGWSLLGEVAAGAESSRLDAIDVAQPVIFAFQVALTALWRSWGIRPSLVFGQSMGEVAAAHAAGALSLADALTVIVERSRLLKQVEGRGATAAVGLVAEEALEAVAGFEDSVAVAGTTGPTSCIISGDPQAVQAIVGELEGRNVYCKLLGRVGAAAHSPQLDPLLPALVSSLAELRPRPSEIPFVSTVTAAVEAGETLGPEYWARNLRQPFQVARAVDQLIGAGHATFLEIGPHPLLAGAVRQSLVHREAEGVALPSLRRGEPELEVLLTSLGELWARGHGVDWELQHRRRRAVVSLPHYPWQRERHWVDAARFVQHHPLLGAPFEAASPPGQRFWQSEVWAEALHYLGDHRVRETVVFPGAAYLEILLAAGSTAQGHRPAVAGLRFDRLLLLPEGDRRQLQVVATPKGAGEAEVSIHSRAEEGGEGEEEWILHAAGRRIELPASPPARLEIEELLAACPEQVPVEEHYDGMAARGLQYGPTFRAIHELWRGPGQALARIELDAVSAGEAAALHLHPCLLDAAIQTVAPIRAPAGGRVPGKEAAALTYLPHGVGRLEVFAPPGAVTWCRARLAEGSVEGDEELLADLDLLDGDGTVIASLSELSLRRLDAGQTRQHRWQDLCYVPAWAELPAKPAPAATGGTTAGEAAPPPGHWLILADRGGTGTALARELRRRGQTATVVRRGSRRRGDLASETVELDPTDSGSLAELVGEATAFAGPPLAGIVHMLALDLPCSEDLDAGSLDRALDEGCGTALAVARALAETPDCGTRLFLVTRDAVVVPEADAATSKGMAPQAEVAPTRSTLWGLGRVLALEHPGLWGGLADLDAGPPAPAAEALATELLEPSEERFLAFRGKRRHAARLRRLRQATGPLTPRPDGAYLVTGGLSGLGLETACWLAEKGARRLLLVGRTAMPPRSEWGSLAEGSPAALRVAAVRRLEALGATVEVGAFDVADGEALGAFLEAYRRQGLPPLRGVVHAAGMVRDRLLAQMDEAGFREVIRPKVHGGWNLHRRTLGDPLDFFLLFSSMTSLFGQLGQASYAAGNSFLDALAHARRLRGLPALALNWGPWSEVGIYARLDEATRRSIDMSGVTPISPAENLRVLSHLAGGEAPQVLVADGDWGLLGKTPLFSELAAEGTAAADREAGADGREALLSLLLAEPEERRRGLEEEIGRAAARVLRTEARRLAVETPLTALGMDSIMAVELKNTVHRELELEVAIVDLFTASIAQLTDKLLPQLDRHPGLEALLEEVEGLSAEETRALLAAEPVASGAATGGGAP